MLEYAILLCILTDIVISQSCTSIKRIPNSELVQANIYNDPLMSHEMYVISTEHPSEDFVATTTHINMVNGNSSKTCPAQCLYTLKGHRPPFVDSVFYTRHGPYWNEPAPGDFVSLNDTKTISCAQQQGFCGADVPIYRYFTFSPSGLHHAYSFSIDTVIEGFVREADPICFGWRDNSTLNAHPIRHSLISTRCNSEWKAPSLAMADLVVYDNMRPGIQRDHWTTTTNVSGHPEYKKEKVLAKILTVDPGICGCALKLQQMVDNQTLTNGRLDHKLMLRGKERNRMYENYTATGERVYCMQEMGACGATVPLYKHWHVLDLDSIHSTEHSGPFWTYQYPARVVCYVWPVNYTETSVVPNNVTLPNLGSLLKSRLGSQPIDVDGQTKREKTPTTTDTILTTASTAPLERHIVKAPNRVDDLVPYIGTTTTSTSSSTNLTTVPTTPVPERKRRISEDEFGDPKASISPTTSSLPPVTTPTISSTTNLMAGAVEAVDEKTTATPSSTTASSPNDLLDVSSSQTTQKTTTSAKFSMDDESFYPPSPIPDDVLQKILDEMVTSTRNDDTATSTQSTPKDISTTTSASSPTNGSFHQSNEKRIHIGVPAKRNKERTTDGGTGNLMSSNVTTATEERLIEQESKANSSVMTLITNNSLNDSPTTTTTPLVTTTTLLITTTTTTTTTPTTAKTTPLVTTTSPTTTTTPLTTPMTQPEVELSSTVRNITDVASLKERDSPAHANNVDVIAADPEALILHLSQTINNTVTYLDDILSRFINGTLIANGTITLPKFMN